MSLASSTQRGEMRAHLLGADSSRMKSGDDTSGFPFLARRAVLLTSPAADQLSLLTMQGAAGGTQLQVEFAAFQLI